MTCSCTFCTLSNQPEHRFHKQRSMWDILHLVHLHRAWYHCPHIECLPSAMSMLESIAGFRTSSYPISCPEMLVMSVGCHEEQWTTNTQFTAVHWFLVFILFAYCYVINFKFFFEIILILFSWQLFSTFPVAVKLLKDSGFSIVVDFR